MNASLLPTLLAALMFISLGIPSALAQGPTADERFESMLGAVDGAPTRVMLEHTWADARQRLMAAAADADRDVYTRLRATSMLANFKQDDVRAFLIELSKDPSLEVRRAAYYTLGRAFGQEAGADAPDDDLLRVLGRGLEDSEVEVRVHTTRALRWVAHPEAIRLLETIAAQDKDEAMQRVARLALKRRGR